MSKCQWGCCDYNTEKAEYVEGSFTTTTTDEDDTVYVCDECGDEFSYEEDAESCCSHWSCNYCGSWAGDQHDAVFCCHQSCYDCGEEGWPDDMESHDCVSDDDDSGCSCCGSSSMGHSSNPPWVVRGDLEYNSDAAALARNPGAKWQQVWGFEPAHHDPVQAAGDYYILESIISGSVGKSHADHEYRLLMSDDTARKIIQMEAEEAMSALVRELAPIFRSYAHLAIGGELRHHVAIGGHILPSSRSRAWAGWKSIYEAVGPQALLDAAELFEEFSGGSYGGKPWADACRVLHAYETNQLSSRVFLDRMFALQHNGGCFLNKVTWGDFNDMSWGVHDLQYKLLPAHGAMPEPDYATLLGVASPHVRSLFRDYWAVAKVRGVRPMPKQPRLDKWMPYVPAPLAEQAQSFANQAEYYEKVAKQYEDEYGLSYASYAADYKQAASDYWMKAAQLKIKELVEGDPAHMTEDEKLAVAVKAKARCLAKKAAAKKGIGCPCWMHGGDKMSNEDGWLSPQGAVTFNPDDPF